ncbi:MAG: hypothetical protein ACXW3X_13025 [Rhodoplanes sp.]
MGILPHAAFAEQGHIPRRSPAARHGKLGPQADWAPTQRDRHLQTIVQRERLGWQRVTGYDRQSPVKTAMFHYKTLIGRRRRPPHELQASARP